MLVAEGFKAPHAWPDKVWRVAADWLICKPTNAVHNRCSCMALYELYEVPSELYQPVEILGGD